MAELAGGARLGLGGQGGHRTESRGFPGAKGVPQEAKRRQGRSSL